MHVRYLFVLSIIFISLMTACDQTPLEDSQESPYQNGAAYPWSYHAKDNVTAQDFTAQQDMPKGLISATNGWGPIEIDRSNGEKEAKDGNVLSIEGKTYEHGYGVHANSELIFDLEKVGTKCTQFKAKVGIDDEVQSRGTVIFQVYLDNDTAVFDSGPMKGKDAAKTVDIDISGKKKMRLVVADGGNDISYDHADWVEPNFICQSDTLLPSATLDKTDLKIYHVHSSTIQATFQEYENGPVNLRLEAAGTEGGQPQNPYPVVLDTPTLILASQPNPETHSITISAPQALTMRNYSTEFQLVISQNGTDVTTIPLKLRILPIKFSAKFEPQQLSGRIGEKKTIILTVTANPPLDKAQPLSIGSTGPGENPFSLTPIGNVRGDGATMQQDIQVDFLSPTDSVPMPYKKSIKAGIAVDSITTGYRHPFYGPFPRAKLELTLLP